MVESELWCIQLETDHQAGAEALQRPRGKGKEPHETELKIKSNVGYRAASLYSVRLKREPNKRFKSFASLTRDGLKPAP